MVFMMTPLFIIQCKLASSVEVPKTKPDDDHPKLPMIIVAFKLFKLHVYIANNSSVVVCLAKAGGHFNLNKLYNRWKAYPQSGTPPQVKRCLMPIDHESKRLPHETWLSEAAPSIYSIMPE